MLDLGVLEPSDAEWSFPVVVVPKPGGHFRFCADYRRLNERTVKDVYSIPRMDDCLDSLGDATVFSTLDCISGYWQIPVAAEDRDKTTFTSHTGLIMFLRIPFGLVNAPASFQRALDIILSGLRWKTCLVYLNDVIVFSWTVDDHIRHLREVLLLEKTGVSLKPSKCHLFQQEVGYLGHVVRPGQLLVNQENIKSLAQELPPRTQTELKSFLGMCNLYRRFIKDYGHITKPLTKLTSKKLPHVLPPLDAAQLAAFEYLKVRLTSTPILALPRSEGLFILDTDACAVQVGCTILQQQPDKSILPVGYYSRGLIPAEKNYSTTDRECLAVVWDCFLLRSYLEGQEFLIRTDHSSLRWLLNMDSSQGQVARWRLRLSEFRYKVCTRPGREHHCADAMSRLPTLAPDRSVIPEEIPCLSLADSSRGWVAPNYGEPEKEQPVTLARMLAAQKEDQRCQDLRDKMDQNDHSRFSETKEGLLVRVPPLDWAVQVYVPFILRQDLLRLEHDVVRAGHPGVNRMYAAIRRHNYWESMAADVYDWVASFASCARNRFAPRRRTAMLKLLPATDPLASLSMDLLGPLTETKTGNVFLLIILERFSKLVQAVPLAGIAATDVSSAFFRD